jgi:hypothetical protein
MPDHTPSACAEFPNDNPALHRGAIWCCAEIGHPASGELPFPPLGLLRAQFEALEADPIASDEPLDALGTIDGIDELTFEDAVSDVPPASEPPPPPESMDVEPIASTDPVEVEAPIEDPFARLVRTVEDVARASGAGENAAACVHALFGLARMDGLAPGESALQALTEGKLIALGPGGPSRTASFTSQVLAWQGILRGERDDFAACGAATLDEWAADVVARVIGPGARTDGIRRELRRRGVAAFGLVSDAA